MLTQIKENCGSHIRGWTAAAAAVLEVICWHCWDMHCAAVSCRGQEHQAPLLGHNVEQASDDQEPGHTPVRPTGVRYLTLKVLLASFAAAAVLGGVLIVLLRYGPHGVEGTPPQCRKSASIAVLRTDDSVMPGSRRGYSLAIWSGKGHHEFLIYEDMHMLDLDAREWIKVHARGANSSAGGSNSSMVTAMPVQQHHPHLMPGYPPGMFLLGV